MTNAAAAQMQHANDELMQVMNTYFLHPALLWAIGIGLLAIALEIFKVIVRKLLRKLRTKPSKRAF